MKEVSSLACNMVFFETNNEKGDPQGEIKGSLEMVVIVSEPSHIQDQVGGLVQFRKIEHLRFAGNAETMREMANYILERTKELEAAENRINKHVNKLP